MQRLIAVTALAFALGACGPRQNAEAPPQAPAPAPLPPTPATKAFYIGRWAKSEADCPAKAWSIAQNALTAPEGSCTFDSVAPI